MTNLFIGFAAGGILCFIIGWLIGSRRRPASALPDDRLTDELRQQISQRDSQLAQLRSQLTEASNARATADAKQAAAETLLVEQRDLHAKALQETKELQARALADLRDVFKAL